jgi:hypothetical protein
MDQVVQTLQEFGLVQLGSQPYSDKGVDHEKHMSNLHIQKMYDFINFEV